MSRGTFLRISFLFEDEIFIIVDQTCKIKHTRSSNNILFYIFIRIQANIFNSRFDTDTISSFLLDQLDIFFSLLTSNNLRIPFCVFYKCPFCFLVFFSNLCFLSQRGKERIWKLRQSWNCSEYSSEADGGGTSEKSEEKRNAGRRYVLEKLKEEIIK